MGADTDTAQSDPSCEQLIDSELERVIDRLRTVLRSQENAQCSECGHTWFADDEPEECPECHESTSLLFNEVEETRQSYEEGVLECSPISTTWRVLLSYGGSSDGFYLYVDPDDGTIVKVEYFYHDWFDGATRQLSGEAFGLVVEMFAWVVELRHSIKD